MRRTTSCFHTLPLELYHRYACVDRAASDSSRRFVVPSTEGSTPQDCLLQAPRKLHDLSEETVHCDSAQWRAHNSNFDKTTTSLLQRQSRHGSHTRKGGSQRFACRMPERGLAARPVCLPSVPRVLKATRVYRVRWSRRGHRRSPLSLPTALSQA